MCGYRCVGGCGRGGRGGCGHGVGGYVCVSDVSVVSTNCPGDTSVLVEPDDDQTTSVEVVSLPDGG